MSSAEAGKRACAEGWERGDEEEDEGEKRGSEEARKQKHGMNAGGRSSSKGGRSAERARRCEMGAIMAKETWGVDGAKGILKWEMKR